MPRRGIDGEFGANMKPKFGTKRGRFPSDPKRSPLSRLSRTRTRARGRTVVVELRENLCRAQTSAWRSDRRRFFHRTMAFDAPPGHPWREQAPSRVRTS
jgi:hypothetical protein